MVLEPVHIEHQLRLIVVARVPIVVPWLMRHAIHPCFDWMLLGVWGKIRLRIVPERRWKNVPVIQTDIMKHVLDYRGAIACIEDRRVVPSRAAFKLRDHIENFLRGFWRGLDSEGSEFSLNILHTSLSHVSWVEITWPLANAVRSVRRIVIEEIGLSGRLVESAKQNMPVVSRGPARRTIVDRNVLPILIDVLERSVRAVHVLVQRIGGVQQTGAR